MFEHAACHLDDGYLDFVVDGSVPEGERHAVATGGWHDAGDYNKYVVNAGVTVGAMLRAWHDFQLQIAQVELDVPESDGPLPEFLAEVKWELDWLLSMQKGDGSVYHKLSAANYSGYMRPEAERDRRYFGEWGSQATASFVAMMALASRETALDAVNHLFGRNVHGRSYVTGLGEHPPLFPHDRRSAADEVEPPWLGYLVGGPHPRPIDWHDQQDDYRTNEIAINWNGALIYALAALLDPPAAAQPAPP